MGMTFVCFKCKRKSGYRDRVLDPTFYELVHPTATREYETRTYNCEHNNCRAENEVTNSLTDWRKIDLEEKPNE